MNLPFRVSRYGVNADLVGTTSHGITLRFYLGLHRYESVYSWRITAPIGQVFSDWKNGLPDKEFRSKRPLALDYIFIPLIRLWRN